MESVSTVSRPFFFFPQNSFSTKRRRSVRTGTKRLPSLHHIAVNEETSIPASKSFMFVLDFDRAKTYVDHFLDSANDACEDLKTLVTIDERNRVVFSCRKSTLEFSAMALLYGCIGILGVKLLVRLSVGLKNALFRSWRNDKVVVRRDRSLGGKEVVVGRTARGDEIKSASYPHRSSSDSSSELIDDWKNFRARTTPRLPNWWPALNPKSAISSVIDKEEYQREANQLVQAVVDYRSRGKDIMERDIVELRRICRTSGVQVSFEITNTRDSFYRASVDFILDVCCSSLGYQEVPEIDGESVQQFIVELAENVGLENLRAARMVSGAVAARSRSLFLQSWAFEAQGKHAEALIELSKICHIFRSFPPDQYSAEMEMVARGLGKNLKMEQREHLFHMFGEVCSEDCHRCAADALGLVLTHRNIHDPEAINY